jgi:hypothetical protein
MLTGTEARGKPTRKTISLPATKRGRRNDSQVAEFRAELQAFADQLLEIRSRLDFKPGKRGWCYLLEEYGVGKGDFGKAGRFIDECRKNGMLPIDFTADDDNRAPENLELFTETRSPELFAKMKAESIRNIRESWRTYSPGSFWDWQETYIEVAVEKIDLKSLFSRVCAHYHVPIWNARGWSDINSRADLMLRFRKHADKGRHCVLLYCGDHDPVGLNISQNFRKNLEDLSAAVGWEPTPDALTIERFGLNAEFIEEHGLSWIEGLETSSGKDLADPKHSDHNEPFVQTYLEKYGARKVEANALVTRAEAGRRLCREAIENYLDLDRISKRDEWISSQRELVKAVLPAAVQRVMAEGGGP